MQPEAAEAVRRRRVIIADDHELARLGLRTMLEPEPDLEVIGEAATGREAVALSSRLQPDLVLMDIRMPGSGRADGDAGNQTRAVPHEHLDRDTSEDPTICQRRSASARPGFVLRMPAGEVVAAVRQVLNGESPLDPKLAAQLIRRLAGQTPPKEQPARMATT